MNTATTGTATRPSPEYCVNPDCGKPRKLRKGSTTSREGSAGQCRGCTARAHKKAVGADPYVGRRWYERAAPKAERVPLKSSDDGYRPSVGTTRIGEAA